MDFSTALTALKHGRKIRRLAWHPGVHVQIVAGTVWMNNGAIWQFSNDGILADDWAVVLDSPAQESETVKAMARAS